MDEKQRFLNEQQRELWDRYSGARERTQREALTVALVLALNAPDEEKAQRASELAERIAPGTDPVTVEKAKANALERVELDQRESA